MCWRLVTISATKEEIVGETVGDLEGSGVVCEVVGEVVGLGEEVTRSQRLSSWLLATRSLCDA